MGMPLQQRIDAFVQLGRAMDALGHNSEWPGYTSSLTGEEFSVFTTGFSLAQARNGWFTPDAIRQAFAAWSGLLTPEVLGKWLTTYDFNEGEDKELIVGIICAGNIPLVGLHDVLSVLITGNRALLKLSDSDDVLLPLVLHHLIRIEPAFASMVSFAEGRLHTFDAVIATGSTNTARYFHYYFSKYPHIIRKGRTSLAILNGSETTAELENLGHDIFDYFGLGCRSVSKIYIPQGYSLDHFFEGIYPFHEIIHHNKYANNYDYTKAIWLLNKENLLDNGFLLLKEDEQLASPTGSLFYSRYDDGDLLRADLEAKADVLQCVIGRGHIPFGQSQSPGLADYADGVDTIQFLLEQRK